MASEHGNDDYDVEPYDPDDPQNEPHPDHIVYQKSFEHLKTQTDYAFGLLRDTLVASDYQNATTKGLTEEVHKRQKKDVDEESRLAVSGDMGLGMHHRVSY